jgi:methylglutaconyl-CoA hydratase
MENVKVREQDGVLTISLNRPEKRNAFFPAMIKELSKAFSAAAKQHHLRAVVLTAEGPSFCAGGDMEWMKSMAKYSMAQNVKDAEQLFALFWSIRSCPVPVIGRVFGHGFGGGAGLVAACDMVAADSATQFCFSEVKWGLVPAVISPFVLERTSSSWVREWFLTAKVFQAPAALQGGLIQFCGSMPEVDAYVADTVKLLKAAAPEAVRETKKLCQSYSTLEWKKVRSQVTRLIARRRVSAEGQLGLQAFLDKRSPDWGAGASQKIR